MANDPVDATIREVLAKHARLSVDAAKIGDHDDLYGAGMTSRASVNVMLALESALDLEFPDQMLRRDVFASVASIRAAVASLRGGA